MTLYDIILIAIALAMDCFAVSITGGVILRQRIGIAILRMCILFGIFQAAMPFFGWLCINNFSGYLETLDHWIAFVLLLFLGSRMIYESIKGDEKKHFNPCKLHTQIILAIATSIDALAVGISFACIGYESLSDIILPITIIGLTSFILAVVGYRLGVKFGLSIERRLRPELLGGIILIIIGIKILLSHLLEL